MSIDIDIESLPTYEQISSKPIRDSAAGFNAAKAALLSAKRDLVELEQTREQAEWRDAAAAEAAIAERKPAPKRTYVAAHDRKTDNARHQVKVAQLALERAERDLIGSLERNGAAWATEVGEAYGSLTEAFATGVNELVAVYAKLSQAASDARVVIGGQRPRIGVIELDRGQLGEVELAAGSSRRATVQVADVLAALSSIGQPEPEAAPVVHPPRKGQGDPRLRGRRDVEDEIAERAGVRTKVEARRQKLLAAQDTEG